ncbi:hypothetical protein CFOL_v3_07464 [Cephalotus follicularis]|uniref:Uncharacterized protein n=1 Tax=Cephalotus follicularis TaxID=3775 RepID=A0A1Q3B7C7_CEPFO|nr:hypothetical protein CFOL_v3_07464 [Cephalotus follicularis]
MKASLKFREEQKPLLRAKIPLSILGLPFQSGVVAGESKELTLNLSTFFDSGPSIKIAYRPNDMCNPFSLLVKTGTGPFGSPITSSMLMGAEFSLLGKGHPRFMLHFKPQFGDFSIKKTQSSVFDKITVRSQNGTVSEDESSSIEVVDYSPEKREKVKILSSNLAGDFAGFLSGVEMTARTALPVRGRAVVNFRWGVRVPAEAAESTAAGFAYNKIPFLVMNKIGIEHVACGEDSKAKKVGPEANSNSNADVAEACFNVRRQLEILQAENGLLKKAIEDLREEIVVGDRNGNKITSGKFFDKRSCEKKSTEGDIKGSAGA